MIKKLNIIEIQKKIQKNYQVIENSLKNHQDINEN